MSLVCKRKADLRLSFLATRRRTEVRRVRRDVRAYGECSLSAPENDLVVKEKIAFRKLGCHRVV